MRPFSPLVCHPIARNDWKDLGGGAAFGDLATTLTDPVCTALDLKAPLTIAANNSGINRHVWPVMQTIRYEFPDNAFTAGPKLSLTWTDGGLQPDRKLAQLPPEIE